MRFPWHKYDELPIGRRNTLQVFITNRCNLHCKGCFARNTMDDEKNISIPEYIKAIHESILKGCKQINLLGGEPLIHPEIGDIVRINRKKGLKTTIYTNGHFLYRFNAKDLMGAKLRVSLYCKTSGVKALKNLPGTNLPIEVCFMVSRDTTVEELLEVADDLEKNYNCGVFFISSIRELDNPEKEFFEDTAITMPMLAYKQLVHEFLWQYNGNIEIHISKRGVFESTQTLPDTHCRFANYFIGGSVIQCPYDVVNLKFQKDYSFGQRRCQQNNTCLMSKIKLAPKK